MIQKITLWFKGKFKKFNHIEENWSQKKNPSLPQMDKGANWSKRWAFLEWYDEDIAKVFPQYWSES